MTEPRRKQLRSFFCDEQVWAAYERLAKEQGVTIDQLIGHLKRSLGITFVVITHDIVSTVNIADRVAMLYGGKLVAWGTVQEVLQSPEPVVRRFFSRNLLLPPAASPSGGPDSVLTPSSHSG